MAYSRDESIASTDAYTSEDGLRQMVRSIDKTMLFL